MSGDRRKRSGVHQLVWVLCGLLAAPPVAWTARPQAEGERQALSVEVLIGQGAINNITLKRAREPVVRVTDATGAPVEGAVVTFVVPSSGPGAVFSGGAFTLSVPTDSQGQAIGRGLQPNNTEGQFEIRVSATHQGRTARTSLIQTNVRPAEQEGGSGKTFVIIGLVAGAVAGAALAFAGGGNGGGSPSPNPNPVPGTTITVGTPVFGPP